MYDLSGDTFFNVDENSGSVFDILTFKLKNIVKEFNDLVIARGFNGDNYKKLNSVIDNGSGCQVVVGQNESFLENCPTNRYYSLMCPFFLKEDKFTTMVNELTSGPEVKGDANNLANTITAECNKLKEDFKAFQTYWTNELKKFEDDPVYKEATTWKVPDNTVKTCSYTTPAVGNLNAKTKKIKDLYSNINLNEKKNTFNGKVTFN
jgi:hypothetical protein